MPSGSSPAVTSPAVTSPGVTGPGASVPAAEPGPEAAPLPWDPLARGCDRILDAAVVLMATWTLVYHLCFLLRLDSSVALSLELVVLGAAVVARRVGGSEADTTDDTTDDGAPAAPAPEGLAVAHPWLVGTTVTAAAVAAVSMALRLPWLLVWVPWLVAAAAGSTLALRTLTRHPRDDRAAAPGPTRRESLVAVGLALVLAVLSLVVVSPNADDLFYVNLSQWVAAHGTFPHRDTLYADLVYPLSNWPPLASYDAGTGALAHLLGVRAATVDYVLVPPVATLLSVLALWRLLRARRIRHVVVAVVAAVAFLLLDGASAYGPGNLWVTRLWQGKVILLCVGVPALLVMALRYVEAPSRRRAGWLGVGGVAAVGCSTTALFLVPVLAVAAATPLVRRAPRRAATLLGALAAYPLAMGAVTVAVGGRSSDDFADRRQFRFDPSWFGHQVFADGVIALLGVAAVLLGCLVVPHPAARVTTAAAATLTGITFVPGLTHLTYDLVGLGPTLWRLTWTLSVAALVGALASYAVTRLRPRAAAVVAVVLVALVATLGHPILAPDTNTTLAVPGHWQRTADDRRATAWILSHTRPGDRVLGPDGLSITVAVTTTAVKTVTPRDYYLDYLREDPTFDYAQRLLLARFANRDPGWQSDRVGPALASLDVRVACVYRADRAAGALLRHDRWTLALTTDAYLCLLPPASPDTDVRKAPQGLT